MGSIITGTGSVLPNRKITNAYFSDFKFYKKDRTPIEKSGLDVIKKLEEISGIKERRFIGEDEQSADLLFETCSEAIRDAGIDKNEIDGIIVAHNSGNMLMNKGATYHSVPNLAAVLKNKLEIDNYNCVAYDILFGCPGWVQGSIQANRLIATGEANHVLVVGLEVASRLLDPHDLDSLLMGDGCGATIFSKNDLKEKGILATATFSHAQKDLYNIGLGPSLNPEAQDLGDNFFKMNGKEVYRYATRWLPQVIKKALDKVNITPKDIDVFFFHQANAKMLKVIAHNLMKLYGEEDESYEFKIPSSIEFLGNTSVATVPTLFDLVRKGKMKNFKLVKGQKYVFASVGSGMHCNAIIYQN